ncbi:hypothetical protein QCA50_017776 [Cerrena zonata]|uniref:DUF6589 domain-containing protein n=1 Tax=Cerrena zonata TaxID=2478898 RepID=A0AAW0FEB8_9APHY
MIFECYTSIRLDKRTELGDGTAAIIHVKKSARQLPSTAVQELHLKRAEGILNPVTFLKVYELHTAAQHNIEEHMADVILRVLLESEEFNRPHHRYITKHKNNQIKALPCGPEHISCEYMMPSMPISEASYEGNLQVWGTVRHRAEKVVCPLGDQLTTNRLRGAAKARCQDRNSEERLDNLVPVWGRLHGSMPFEKSLHKQYMGTESGFGFKQALTLLFRHDLAKATTAGAFHERFGRLLEQMLEAHLRNLWCLVANVEDVSELTQKSPEELRKMAQLIVHQHASAKAMNTVFYHHSNESDEVKAHTVGLVRDLLHYAVLKHSIKHGNVGMMEALLPYLLFRFAGGRNSHYCTQVLETLQGIHREWPSEVADFVRDHCWLINLTGKRDGHTSADRVMEAGIKDIKVSYRPTGPNVNWKYPEKLHPAIPVIRAVSAHAEDIFKTWTRYKAHTSPHDIESIKVLQCAYKASDLYTYKPGRNLPEGNTFTDFVLEGAQKLPAAITRWADGRAFPRSTEEDWTENDPMDISD